MGVLPTHLKNDLDFYNREAKRWWDSTAEIHTLNQMNPIRFQYFDTIISNWSGVRVLDVGCGGGYTCEYLARRGAIATGIDQSAPCIEAAQRHAHDECLAIDYHQGMAHALPYADHQFDVVTCLDALEHIEHWQDAIAQIYRVLKPGGVFLFDTINRTFWSKIIMIWLLENIFRKIPQGIHDWEMFIAPEELTEVMVQCGFQAVQMRGMDVFGRTPGAIAQTFWHYQETGHLRGRIDEDMSVIYVGRAIAPTNKSD